MSYPAETAQLGRFCGVCYRDFAALLIAHLVRRGRSPRHDSGRVLGWTSLGPRILRCRRAPGTREEGEPCADAFVALLWQSPPSRSWRSQAVSPMPLPTSATVV